jgi:hypothetical protein
VALLFQFGQCGAAGRASAQVCAKGKA